jgi:hypothetical protein
VKSFRRAAALAAIAAGILAGPVLACGDGWMGVNLVATPDVKAALRTAYLAANRGVDPARVGSPLWGQTYYGSYSDTWYAVATFSVGGAAAYPTVFRTDSRGRWHVRRQTHGGVCSDVVPIDLIRTWWLEHWGGRCYVLPA